MRFLCCLFLLFSSLATMAQVRIIPHLTRVGGGFSTTIIIENTTVNQADYSFLPYDENGQALDPVTGTVPARATVSLPADQLFDSSAASFTIDAEGLFVSAAYNSVTAAGSPAHVSETAEQASAYRLFAGDWSTVFDGIAVVNLGLETAAVWVAQRDALGEIIASKRIADALAPMGKTLFVIGSPNDTVFQHQDGYSYEVYCSQNIAITALRGNLPGSTFMWANQAAPFRKTQTTRDAQGIWFLEGGDLYSALETMGYAIAQDRLWQINTFVRSTRGTLSEWLGTRTLESDKLARLVGYSEEELLAGYEALEPQAKIMVRAYADGVNRHVAETNADPSLIPSEFIGLRFLGVADAAPQKLTPADILAMAAGLLIQFDPNNYGSYQMTNAALLQDLQERYPDDAATMFDDLRWLNDPLAVTMIHSDPIITKNVTHQAPLPGPLRTDINFKALADDYLNRLNRIETTRDTLNARYKMGSYAWVVSGAFTASGNPILYSGPQMGFSAPPVTVEGSIKSDDLTISGMTVPGIPGIIIGRTPHHAWSMQVGHANSADLYIEPPSALTTPSRVEIIRVAGGEDVSMPVYKTRHGIVLETEEAIISWRYTHHGIAFGTIQAFFNLSQAENMDQFGEALLNVGVSQHFCYADRDGNIAYWMSGRSPIRPAGEYRLPQGSVAPPLEYDLEVFRPLPHDRNTPVGYYGGWNNKSEIGYDNGSNGDFFNFGVFNRAHAVDDRLKQLVAGGNVTFSEVRDLAIEISATYPIAPRNDAWPFNAATSRSFNSGGGNTWSFVRGPFNSIVAANPTEARLAALEIMGDWDGYFIEGGPVRWIGGPDRADAWMLQDAWIRRAMSYLFDEVDFGLAGQATLFNTLLHGLYPESPIQPAYNWFGTQNAELPQDFESIVLQSLDESLEALGPLPWGIGQRGFINYSDSLGTLFHRTPYSSRSTYAHCVEFGPEGPVRIESMFPLGPSGKLSNPNSLSMAPFFDNWDLRVFPLFD